MALPALPVERQFRKIHKKEVCRYWLMKECMKGDACEFLHEFDHDKMPVCKKGIACSDPSCVLLKHPSKENVAECPNYEAGFCSFGYSCLLKHSLKQNAPLVSSQFLFTNPALGIVKEKSKKKFFRKSACPYWVADGWCPYFDICAFSH